MARSKIRLGDLLVRAGKITKQQLVQILELQKIKGGRIGELLVEEGILKEEEIIKVLEEQLGIKSIDLSFTDIDFKAIKLVKENLCRKHLVFPFALEEGNIKVAFVDPLNIWAIDDISIATGLKVIPFIATTDNVKKAIDKYYSTQSVENAVLEISKEKNNQEIKEDTLKIDDVKNSPTVKLVASLIKNAIEQNASDIHIEPYEERLRVRYRIDGILKEISSLDIGALAAIVTRIKIMANLNIAEKRIPQDGRIVEIINGNAVDMRVSIIPLITGEKVVIRILDKTMFLIGKDNLGMSDENLKIIEAMEAIPYGLILATGPTGSGKSTTLYTMLNDLNTENRNVVTVEDPVEYSVEGINQVNVNQKAGLNFANTLRSILRQDPDVVMIGEMRDNETAEIGIRAAITGHLVLSTLHTNDAPSSVIRLIDMGIPSYLVATAVKGVIAQRLVRKLCPYCKKEYAADAGEKKILSMGNEETVRLYRPVGCTKCNYTGYSGRQGIYEIMVINREIKDAIVDCNNINVIKDKALKNGMVTLEENCKNLVLDGITSVEEMLRVIFVDDI